MKKKLTLFLSSLLFLTLIIVSCRKEFTLFEDKKIPDRFELEAAKIFYAKGATLTPTTYKELWMNKARLIDSATQKRFEPFIKLAPQWKKSYTLLNSNGETLIVVPTIERELDGKSFQIRRFFIFTKKDNAIVSGRIVEFLGMNYSLKDKINEIISEYQSNQISDLTGAIFEYDLNYFKLSGQMVNGGRKTGQGALLYNLPTAITSINKLSSTGPIKSSGWYDTGPAGDNGCRKLWFCQQDNQGIGVTCFNQGYLSGSCDLPPSSGSDSGYDSSNNTGGGGYGGNNNPTEPAELPNELPCSRVPNVTSNQSNSTITTQNANIRNQAIAATSSPSGPIEYGADEKLSSWVPGNYKPSVVRAGTATSWTENFSWNSTDGYSIGYSHYHPDGTTASPSDIFELVYNLSRQELKTASDFEKEFYKRYASVTTLSSTGETYVITVADWATLKYYYEVKYLANPTQFNAEFNALTTIYKNNNPGASEAEATEYGLKGKLGNSINLFKKNNQTGKFDYVLIDAPAGEPVKMKSNPCPNN
ncbi:hypothetical protein ACFOWA_00155 [Pedobacter lithocola]|uniref:Lipoprotein n=1 Tax=Pedobacter lithocola TaxID=1908239 RepID=A0ABV8P3W8_9SPHI